MHTVLPLANYNIKPAQLQVRDERARSCPPQGSGQHSKPWERITNVVRLYESFTRNAAHKEP